MNYYERLKHCYQPAHGFMNDPNGLVWFNGYFHSFYQYRTIEEQAEPEPAHWGHCRTKDFVTYEELPVALYPDKPYDRGGCWSGTATVKDGVLVVYYTGVLPAENGQYLHQCIAMATSTDGIHFVKPEAPIIAEPPADGCFDHRDPAYFAYDGKHYLITASRNAEGTEGRLLLWRADDLEHYRYVGILSAFPQYRVCECPSMIPTGDGRFILLNSGVSGENHTHFIARCGRFDGRHFEPLSEQIIDRGPDQYAAQAFNAPDGRHLLLTWGTGWVYNGFLPDRSISCLATPRQVIVDADHRVRMVPIAEWEPFLVDRDPAVKTTDTGLIIERGHHPPVVIPGPLDDVKIMRDGYFVEVFVNNGERIYSAVL